MNLFLCLLIVLLIVLIIVPGALVIAFKVVLIVGAIGAIVTLFAVWLFNHLSGR